jgi:predicted TIM-barrel fold metal-dependent hydrolase
MITDAQVHLWEVDRPDRPWPKEQRGPPHRPNGFSAEELLAEMDPVGVDRAVIVPPAWAGESNATALEAAGKYPERFAVMGRIDALAPDALNQMERWKDQPGMLGIRMSFALPHFAAWLEDGTLDWFWAAAERFSLPLMVLVGGKLGKVHAIAQRHPDLTLIVDHMGRISELRGPAAFADLDDLLALARYPGVLVKTSAAPCYSDQAYPFADLHPFLHRMYDSFGPRRLLWGSDLTRLPGPYAECLDHFRQGLDFLSAEDKEWILGKTAAEALDWPEARS